MALARPRQWAAASPVGRARRPPSAIAGTGARSAQPLLSSGSPSSSSSGRRFARAAAAGPSASAIDGAGAAPAPSRASHRHGRRRPVLSPPPRAAPLTAATTKTTTAADTPKAAVTFSFACPICHDTPFRLPAADPYASDCACPRCGRTFLVSRGGTGTGFVDLTLTSGAPPAVFEQRSWVGTELFRTEAVSSIYERGWRQGFARAGFPGPQREFDLAMRYFAPVLEGADEGAGGGDQGGDPRPVLVDASCGTGLFTRLFARSGEFSGIVALDYSETMLRETRRLLAASSPPPPTPVVAVRADIARLPFATGSVRAIHAGAALHCWPQPSAAMAEISRVLAPGGVFAASTFLNALAPLGAVVGDDRVRPLARLANPFGLSSSFRSWEEAELTDLCREVGLVNYTRTRDRAFILFAAQKPRF